MVEQTLDGWVPLRCGDVCLCIGLALGPHFGGSFVPITGGCTGRGRFSDTCWWSGWFDPQGWLLQGTLKDRVHDSFELSGFLMFLSGFLMLSECIIADVVSKERRRGVVPSYRKFIFPQLQGWCGSPRKFHPINTSTEGVPPLRHDTENTAAARRMRPGASIPAVEGLLR